MMNTTRRNPLRRTQALDASQFRALFAHPAMRAVLLSDDEMSIVTVENSNTASSSVNTSTTAALPPTFPQQQCQPPAKIPSQTLRCEPKVPPSTIATGTTVSAVPTTAAVSSLSSILTSNASSASSTSSLRPPTPADPAL